MMKFKMNILQGVKSLAIFEFEILGEKPEDIESLYNVERFFNERTNVRVHIFVDTKETEK